MVIIIIIKITNIENNILFNNEIDMLFKICHKGSFVVCTQSLVLLFQLSKNNSNLKDRYYQVLYESILYCPQHQGNTIMVIL